MPLPRPPMLAVAGDVLGFKNHLSSACRIRSEREHDVVFDKRISCIRTSSSLGLLPERLSTIGAHCGGSVVPIRAIQRCRAQVQGRVEQIGIHYRSGVQPIRTSQVESQIHIRGR